MYRKLLILVQSCVSFEIMTPSHVPHSGLVHCPPFLNSCALKISNKWWMRDMRVLHFHHATELKKTKQKTVKLDCILLAQLLFCSISCFSTKLNSQMPKVFMQLCKVISPCVKLWVDILSRGQWFQLSRAGCVQPVCLEVCPFLQRGLKWHDCTWKLTNSGMTFTALTLGLAEHFTPHSTDDRVLHLLSCSCNTGCEFKVLQHKR